eukprot:g38947.t1
MKQEADKKSKIHTFARGDKVLVLLPVVADPFKARFSGPNQIEKKLSQVNYLVKMPDRKKLSAELFERLREAKLVISLAKPEFVKAEAMFLGHIRHGRMTLTNVKTKAIEEFPRPSLKKEMLRFLGLSRFCQMFIPN